MAKTDPEVIILNDGDLVEVVDYQVPYDETETIKTMDVPQSGRHDKSKPTQAKLRKSKPARRRKAQ
jgi:hypothetical protein